MAKSTPEELANLLFPEADDETLQESILSVPPEQRRLHTETYDFSISTILQYLNDGRMAVPEFQRRYVWSDSQASRLVESLIIQCPIPVIYLNQEKDERLSVIDGNQRLTSLRRFVGDGFPLKGLTAYPELEGNRFSDLDARFQRHITNRTLRCIVIAKDTHPQVKFDVFERLNSGSVKLTAQELRHGLFFGALMKHLERLNKNKEWKKLTGGGAGEHRMRGEELIVRFLAMHYDLEHYRKPLADFLNGFAERNRSASRETLAEMTDLFERTVESVAQIYGPLAFRVYDKDQRAVSPFNSALFDAEMISISRLGGITGPVADKKRAAYLKALGVLFQEEAFIKSITRATSNTANVKYRIDAVEALVKTLV
jgi:hypothetical protein